MNPRITILLADDSPIIREGVNALLSSNADLEVIGSAEDLNGLLALAQELQPQVVVTDIRMPPRFMTEGIDAAHEIRRESPETGIVILSQYDDPHYALSLLSRGAKGYAYLLKERIAKGDQLADAIRQVAIGRTWLDPQIVEAMVAPLSQTTELTTSEEQLLQEIASGHSIKLIATSSGRQPTAVSDAVDRLFLKLAQQAGAGERGALERLRMLHYAIVESHELQQSFTRFLPRGVADVVKQKGTVPGESQLLDVTVLISDVRDYSTIAEKVDPSTLASMLNDHRGAMSEIVSRQEGTVMDFAGDAVMAVFGAPIPIERHANQAFMAATEMQSRQRTMNASWRDRGLLPFELGIGLSTGTVAAALLGSDEKMEYSVVGDSVNLAQRLQQWADKDQIVMSEATHRAIDCPPDLEELPPRQVKGRSSEVKAYRYRVR
ncbi:MAG: response regulator [Actinobacteria bacterium]|nr:response regulator [Actinomycetota bacterium]